jgi:hypothetical protein
MDNQRSSSLASIPSFLLPLPSSLFPLLHSFILKYHLSIALHRGLVLLLHLPQVSMVGDTSAATASATPSMSMSSTDSLTETSIHSMQEATETNTIPQEKEIPRPTDERMSWKMLHNPNQHNPSPLSLNILKA